MIQSNIFKDKTYAIVGLGQSGIATLKSLESSGAHCYAWDDSVQKTDIDMTPIDAMPWDKIDALVLTPGIPLTHPTPHASVLKAQEHNVPIIGDIDLLMQAQPDASYIGITGTNGKSTTTALIHHILKTANLKTQVGGNIGIPALSLNPLGKDGFYVLELSSYQLDLLKEKKLSYSILLNITPDHIDRHGTLDNYYLSKKRIFDLTCERGKKIIAGSDDLSQKMAAGIKECINLASKSPIEIQDNTLMANGNPICTLANNFALQGPHNAENVLAATTVSAFLHIEQDLLQKAFNTFQSLAHRQENAGIYQNIQFVNDSKATNAVATLSALKRFDNIYWILGGQAKDGGLDGLEPYFSKIRHAFLIGNAAEQFAQKLDGHVAHTQCGDLETATQTAFDMAKQDASPSTVLLSPACASFDQFKNFEERGTTFKQLVQQHLEQTKEVQDV